MAPSDFYLIVILGFVSSLHCVQMCGPIVLTYSAASNSAKGRRALLPMHLAYNAGRTLTYMLFGAVAGIAGGAMAWVGHLAGIENVAAIVAGSAMVVMSIAMFGFGTAKWRGFAMPGGLLRRVSKFLSASSVWSKFLLGMLMGLLPCGLVYAALMKAVGTGTLAGGALTLFGFGLGTSFALIAVGIGSSAMTHRIARWGTTVSAVTVLIMGAILVIRGAFPTTVAHCHVHMMTS